MSIFDKECDIGNIEYKVSLKYLSNMKSIRYATQLNYRILEGEGHAIYIIGITDNGIIKGIDESIELIIKKINYICLQVNSKISFILYCNFNYKKFIIVKIISNFDLNDLSIII